MEVTTLRLCSSRNASIDPPSKDCSFLSIKRNTIIKNILFKRDNFGDPLLIYLKHNFDNIANVLYTIDNNDLKKQNNCGQTIIHQLSTDECLTKLLSSPEIKTKMEDVFNIKDNFGKLYIDYALETKNDKNISAIFAYNAVNEYNITNVDNSGVTLFSKILCNSPDNAKLLTKLLTNKLLSIKNRDGINNLGQIIMYSHTLLTHICSNIEQLNIDLSLFDNVDNNGRTCLMLAVEYNPKSFNILIKQQFVTLKHFMSHKLFGSCLTKAIKYNQKCIKDIIESKIFADYNNDILNGREYDIHNKTMISMNIIQLACKYSSDALIFLINTKYLDELIYEIVGSKDDKINSLKLAIIYQPDCIDTLLNSQYYRHSLIEQTNEICDVSCLMDSLQYQPSSFLRLIRSNKMTEFDIKFREQDPLKSFYRLVKTDSSNSLKNIEEFVPLLRFTNEPCEANDKTVCGICYTNKSNILFEPCYHQACITCALHLNKCHKCRTDISNRLPFNK